MEKGLTHSLAHPNHRSSPCLDGAEKAHLTSPPAYIALFFTRGGVAHRSSSGRRSSTCFLGDRHGKNFLGFLKWLFILKSQ